MGAIVQNRHELGRDGTLLFVHIPKTAGSTLNAVLDVNYPANTIYSVESPIATSLDSFRRLSPDRKRSLRVIRGHGVLGLHAELEQPCLYATLLRNPIDRVVSQYNFIRNAPGHPRYGDVLQRAGTLQDYLENHVNPQADNGQVRALAGLPLLNDADVPFGACSDSMLASARANLARCALVGLTENFDAFLVLASRLLGWKHLLYTRRKVGRARPSVEALSSSERDLILACNVLDMELYRIAQDRFHADVRRQGWGFRATAARLRWQNRLRAFHL